MRFGKTRMLLLSIPFLFLAQACGNSTESPASPSASSPSTTNAPPASPVSETPNTTQSAPVEIPEPVMTFDAETLKNTTGKTLVRNISTAKDGANNTSYAIVSKAGTVAIVDPYSLWSDSKILNADIVVVTHKHTDHYDEKFVMASTNAKISISQEDSFTIKDMNVTSIKASHTPTFFDAAPSDYIYVFEVDGLRIAHFGDLGQDELTPEQLEKIGKIDIMLTRFSNISDNSATTASTIKALELVKPILVIPTHYEPEIVKEVISTAKLIDKGEAAELAIDRVNLDAIKETEYYMLK